MDNSAKPREEHRGPTAPHIGQDHFEKDQLERAARDAGQSTYKPGSARRAIESGDNILPNPAPLGAAGTKTVEKHIAKAKADLDHEKRAP